MARDNYSEVFDKYVQIMEEKGLFNNDEKPLKVQASSSGRDMSKEQISAIEALYGIKPEGIEYKFNIVEHAHKDSFVVIPTYDKVNGLVENQNEQEAIIRKIVLKTPNGSYDLHKMAKESLMKELAKVANHMDLVGQDKLRVLADDCIDKLAIKKQAVPWLVMGIGAAVGAGLYALHFFNSTLNSDNTMPEAISNIRKYIESVTHPDFLDKFNVPEKFSSNLDKYQEIINELDLAFQEYYSHSTNININSDNLEEAAKPENQEQIKESKEILLKYFKAAKKAGRATVQMLRVLRSPLVKKHMSGISGAVSSAWGWLFGDNMDLLITAMDNLIRAINVLSKDKVMIKSKAQNDFNQLKMKEQEKQNNAPLGEENKVNKK